MVIFICHRKMVLEPFLLVLVKLGNMLKMIKCFFLLLLGVIFLACDGERVNPAQESFEFYEKAKIVDDFPYAGDGDKVVFHHYYVAEDEESVADDEYAEEVFFEVSNQEDFYLEDEALKQVDFIFKQYCYCPTFDKLEITDGYLKGERKGNDRFLLEANIKMKGYYLFEGDTLETQILHSAFTGLFKRAVLPQDRL